MRRTQAKHFRGCWKAAALAMMLIAGNFAHAAGGQQRAVKPISLPESGPDPHPVWPDNGIAQRKLPGAHKMFVEQDKRGQWHAWATVVNGTPPSDGIGRVTALNFFSGKIVRGETGFERGKQDSGFYDQSDRRYGSHIAQPRSKGFDYTDFGFPSTLKDELTPLSLGAPDCPANVYAVKGGLDEHDWEGANPKWIKVPLYRVGPAQARCTHGAISSTVGTTMDLKDGTFLATMTCWVFRLRKSDLSPVGDAPALRVIDKAAVQAAIDKAKGQDIRDASDYLSKALGLSFDAENSCTDNF